MDVLGTIGSVGLGVAGDLIGNKMQQSFNAREAQKNRDWQTEMSNTAYQRAATDLDAAGLNRILALGSPSSTPSGATASIEAPKLGATGVAAASAKAQIEQANAQAKLTKAMEQTEHQKARLTKAEADKAALFKEPMEHFAPLVNSTAKGAAEFVGKAKESMGHRVEEIREFLETVKQAPNAVIQAGQKAKPALQKAKDKLKSLWDYFTLKYKN